MTTTTTTMVEGILDRASAKPGPKLSKALAREVWTHLLAEGAYQLAGEETYLFKVGGGVSTYYNFTAVGRQMRVEVEEVDHRTEVNYACFAPDLPNPSEYRGGDYGKDEERA